MSMQLVRWVDVAEETISQEVRRQVIWGEKATLARFSFAKGAHVLAHKHDSEQHTCVIEGAIKARVGNESSKEVIVHAGEVLVIPPNVAHEVWVLQDSLLLDFFAPDRKDWRSGQHNYLAGRQNA
jgi:quercetin dioxygenase-like cupin family protein